MNQSNLQSVDWSLIPPPVDDGAAEGLIGRSIPFSVLHSTQSRTIDLASLKGRTVVYAYPMTGKPGVPLPEDWDMIPGARGCTPESCAFADHFNELSSLDVQAVFGLSTQDRDYQLEAAMRLHLPFELLSDHDLRFTTDLGLPTMVVGSMTLLKRLTMVIKDGTIVKVFYPVFPPDAAAREVIDWLYEKGDA